MHRTHTMNAETSTPFEPTTSTANLGVPEAPSPMASTMSEDAAHGENVKPSQETKVTKPPPPHEPPKEADPVKPPTLREMQEAVTALRTKMTGERKRLKQERTNRKEHVRVFCILGELIAHHGGEHVKQALDVATWLKPDKRLAVEHYFGLLPRVATTKQEPVDKPAS